MLSKDRQAARRAVASGPVSVGSEASMPASLPGHFYMFLLQYDSFSLCSELILETYSSDKICYFLTKGGSVTPTHPRPSLE